MENKISEKDLVVFESLIDGIKRATDHGDAPALGDAYEALERIPDSDWVEVIFFMNVYLEHAGYRLEKLEYFKYNP